MKLSLPSAGQLNAKGQLNVKQPKYHYFNLIYFHLTVVAMSETYDQIEARILEALSMHENQLDCPIFTLVDKFNVLYPHLYT